MNTTELIARLKLASEKATCGRWELSFSTDSDDAVIDREVEGFMPICIIEGAHPESGYDDDFQQEQQANAEFIALASPENVLALVEALESAQAIRAAAEKLVRCKGRYHSEQNYRDLAALFGVTTPDLPPMDETLTERDADKKIIADSVVLFETLRQRIAELEGRAIKFPPKVERDDSDGYWMLKGQRVSAANAAYYNEALKDVALALFAAGIKCEVKGE